MAINQEYNEYRVNDLPTSGNPGDRYYLNVGGGKYMTYIMSDGGLPTRESGAEFLEKDTVASLRAMDVREIWAIQNGYYKGVKLNGYYQEGDTPAPIEYYLSDTTASDDGGSVFEVSGVKLEHEFVDLIHLAYFGENFIEAINLSNKINIPVMLDKDRVITVSEGTIGLCPRGLLLNGYTLRINGNYIFSLDSLTDNFEISGGTIETFGVNSSDLVSGVPLGIFSFHNTEPSKQLVHLSIKDLTYVGIGTNTDGSTRARTLINARDFYKVDISNVVCRNSESPIIIRTSDNISITNTVFYNTGTGVYGDNISNLSISFCELHNTIEQTNHFDGITIDSNPNGKDLIFATGKGISVSNCKSYNPIERLAYIIADDVIIQNNYSLNGDGFKAVGNYSGDNAMIFKKNVTIINNVLEIDENLKLRHLSNIGFTQCYKVDNYIIKNNIMKVIYDMPIEDRSMILHFASISRSNKNILIEGNVAEVCYNGFVRNILNTPSQVIDFGEDLVKNLRIIGNTMSVLNNTYGAIINNRTAGGVDTSVMQVKNVEILNNVLEIEDVNLELRPNSMYEYNCVDGFFAKGNILAKGILPGNGQHAHYGVRNKIFLNDVDIPVTGILGTITNQNTLLREKGSYYSYIQKSINSKVSFESTDSETPISQSGIIKYTHNSNTDMNINFPSSAKEATISFSIRGGDFFICKYNRNTGAFTDIVGVRDVGKLTFSSNNLRIITGGDFVSATIEIY